MSTPSWPLDDEVAAIKESIASIQQSAGQAETNSSVAALEAAIDQKAIQYLDRALSDIQAKETAWKDETRSAQLANALQQRTRVVEQVKEALDGDLNDKWVTKEMAEKIGIAEEKVDELLKAGEPQESSTTESSASPAPQGPPPASAT